MFGLGTTVVYGTAGVCTVDCEEEKKIGRVTKKYLVLKPVLRTGAMVYLPKDNDVLLSKIRSPFTRETIKSAVDGLHDTDCKWIDSELERSKLYKQAAYSADLLLQLKLYKMLTKHQDYLLGTGKRLHITDDRALSEIERVISDEIAFVLQMTVDTALKMVRESL